MAYSIGYLQTNKHFEVLTSIDIASITDYEHFRICCFPRSPSLPPSLSAVAPGRTDDMGKWVRCSSVYDRQGSRPSQRFG